MKCEMLRACLLIAGLSLAITAGAESERMPQAPRYNPPYPSAPKVRVDGRVRGVDDALLTLTVLAPEHVGLTTKEQPCLYWFQSKSTKTRFELTIMERKSINPLLEVGFDDPPDDGIQKVCLEKYNIKLKVGVEYRWTVAMVLDPANRSKDVLASGMIKRIEPNGKLTERLSKADQTDHPYIYADEGIWYDSLEALSAMIDEKPGDKKLHEVRAVYFMQAGLPEAARHEMQLASVKTTARPE